jgi:hypothetical protein
MAGNASRALEGAGVRPTTLSSPRRTGLRHPQAKNQFMLDVRCAKRTRDSNFDLDGPDRGHRAQVPAKPAPAGERIDTACDRGVNVRA